MANALVEKTRNELAAAKKRPKNAMLDLTRGALMGVTTDVLGYPVDLATMAMRPFGYDVEQPVGGSDWLAQHLTSPTGSIAETAGRTMTGMVTPGADDMLRMMGVLKPKAPVNELITYHGSPHRINNVDEQNPMGKFDLSKVGTGEGAQAYGHGIYLAENPQVARQYVGAGNPWFDTNAAMYGNKSIDDLYNAAMSRVDQLNRQKVPTTSDAYRKATAEHYFWENIMTHRHPQAAISQAIEDAENWPELAEFAKRINVDDFTGVPKGNFYTVDLPDEHIAKMLDWDAPLSEQPEAVRRAFVEIQDKYVPFKKQDALGGFDLVDKDTGGLMGLYFASEKDAMDYIGQGVNGREVYETFARHMAGSSMDGQIGQRKASEHLRSLGIPGIKYFDGGSRGKGEGTRNFVIFDGDTAKILKRE